MKEKNRGVTLVTLTVYIILTLVALGMLGMMTSHFRNNLNNVNQQTVYDAEFDKLNLQLLKEMKAGNNLVDEENTTENKIVFTNGNYYIYDEQTQGIYLNDNIKIAEHIKSFSQEVTEVNGKQQLTVTVTIAEKKRIMEYVSQDGVVIAGIPAIGAGERAETISKYETAVIPAGFTVSGKTSESSIDGGLVIYLIDDKTDADIKAINWSNETEVLNLQKTYDQFVWIPITDINDMFMCQSEDGTKSCNITGKDGVAKCTTHNSTAMAGRLYASDVGDNFNPTLTNQTYTTTGLREPDIVSNTTSGDGNATNLTQMSSILGVAGYGTKENFKVSLQKDYNNFATSVCQNKGFWVGRYETSNMVNTDTNATVKTVAGTTTGIRSITWYRMYAQQKKYAENKNLTTVKSSMIQGAAYDQVLKFVNTASYNVTAGGNVSHDLSAEYQTGGLNYSGTIPYNDFSKNIYDLEGNVFAWTLEAFNNNLRLCRGARYKYSGCASSRGR